MTHGLCGFSSTNVTTSAAKGDVSLETQSDGSFALHAQYRLPVPLSVPEAVYLVPYGESSSAEQPLWDDAIFLTLP